MKNHTLLLAALAFAILSLASCELDDVSFDSTLEENILVIEESEGTNVAYEETIVLDATTDPDINKYKSKIKGFKIRKLSYQIVNYNGQPAVFNGSLSFGDASQTSPIVLASVTNLDIQQAYNLSQVYELSLNQADIDKIAALLKEDKAVKIYLTGTLSQTPVTFEVNVIMDVTVEADAL